MKPMRIVVLGGTGFVGRHLVPRLQADGHTLTLLSRNREQRRELGVLPRVHVLNADVHDPAELVRHLSGANAAINLVGILNESGSDGRGFDRAHVELTAKLIDACTRNGVRRLLAMSALRAGEGSSHYLRTRGNAEALVRRSGLDWTIFRPSVIFGPGDGLFCRFANLLRLAPVLPLARPAARFAPVFVGDVAEAFARALVHPHSVGHSYDLVGRDVISLRDLVRWTGELMRRRRWIIGLPDALGRVQAYFGEWLPGKPISRDNFRSLLLDSVSERDGLGELGIVPTRMQDCVPALFADDAHQAALDRFRRGPRRA